MKKKQCTGSNRTINHFISHHKNWFEHKKKWSDLIFFHHSIFSLSTWIHKSLSYLVAIINRCIMSINNSMNKFSLFTFILILHHYYEIEVDAFQKWTYNGKFEMDNLINHYRIDFRSKSMVRSEQRM